MRRALLLVFITALALPASAFAHAALLKTDPSASAILSAAPTHVVLTYSEAVEPRFAIVSVTNAANSQETDGPPARSATNPDELDVPLQRVSEGWYLVFWRVISADGHPVRGAFTFAVGPNPGPAPQFAIPSLSETAVTPQLIAARWVVFMSLLAAVGLFTLRAFVARPLLHERPRSLAVAFWIAIAVALVATPVYVLLATAQFALRSATAVGALVPLMEKSAFGRGYLRLELLLALFAVAGGIAMWTDRARARRRTVAELIATTGALLAAGAALLVPAVAGHAAQTAPRAASIVLDWLHVASASLWVGGLTGILVLWRSLPVARRMAGLAVCVPRFSNVAFASVLLLLGSGVAASVIRLPTLGTLWGTSYGQAILVKAGLLAAALLLAAVNLLRTKPALRAPSAPASAAVLLRRLVAGETLLVATAVGVAAVLSSLPPPPKALAGISGSVAHAGPGPISTTLDRDGYRFVLHVDPNRAAVPNEFAVDISRAGVPVRGADVMLRFDMLDMTMQSLIYRLSEVRPGRYEHSAPALVMAGHWGLTVTLTPRSGQPVSVVVVDRAGG
jgi:copper transport protein